MCDCGYAATSERAEGTVPAVPRDDAPKPAERVDTPGMKTIEEVAGFLGVEPWRLVKTIIYEADGRPVAALIRGDREINEAKLAIALGANLVVPAPPELIEKATGAPVGFAGPVGLSGIEIMADRSVEPLANVVVGGNESDTHIRNVNCGRDFDVTAFHDIALVCKGDHCP